MNIIKCISIYTKYFTLSYHSLNNRLQEIDTENG